MVVARTDLVGSCLSDTYSDTRRASTQIGLAVIVFFAFSFLRVKKTLRRFYAPRSDRAPHASTRERA
eukprot:350048-Chlamydomonas_euryale.AAC.11